MAAAVLGITVPAPLRWIVEHQGIKLILVALVFSTALTIRPRALYGVTSAWRVLAVTLVVSATVLPALAFLVSRLVASGGLRYGLLALGLAPCEIASVATTAMAKGDAAFSAASLIGSTLITTVVAGPLLALEVGGSSVHPGGLVISLVLVVGVPLAAGLTVSGLRPLSPRDERVALAVATASVAGLVALVSAEIPSR